MNQLDLLAQQRFEEETIGAGGPEVHNVVPAPVDDQVDPYVEQYLDTGLLVGPEHLEQALDETRVVNLREDQPFDSE